MSEPSPEFRISAVMPNRNHSKELQISLRGLTEQSRMFDEIIVIDDASTDDSVAVIEAFQKGCPALRLLRNSTQQGVAKTVSRGIAEANGTHILLASADERIDGRMCEIMAGALAAHPDVKLVVSKYTEWTPTAGTLVTYGPDTELGMWYVPDETPIYIGPERFHALLDKRLVWLSVNTALFSKAALLEVGEFDPALRWHSDWFAIYTIAFRYGFVAVPEALAWFRLAEASYSAKGMNDILAQRAVMYAIQDKARTAEFRDVGRALMRSPSPMAPFMRPMLLALIRAPRHYGMLGHILRWWLGQVIQLKRPGALFRLRRHLLALLRG